MYICNDSVCDPCCDFCWFCAHGELGDPVYCKKKHEKDFSEGIGYCNDFKCSLHEEKPQDEKTP